MYIYNITFHVENEIVGEWLDYLTRVFIPKMLKSKTLKSALTSKVVGSDNENGSSFSVQFYSEDKESIDKFVKTELSEILSEIHQKFSPKMVYFTTELDVIDKQN